MNCLWQPEVYGISFILHDLSSVYENHNALPAPLFFTCISRSCYRMRKSQGGGQIETIPARTINANDIAVPKGFKIEPVTSALSFPTACTFDDEGNLYVIEAGYSYGAVWGEPKLLG